METYLDVSHAASGIPCSNDTNHSIVSKPLCLFKFVQKTDRLIFYQSSVGWIIYCLLMPLGDHVTALLL